MPEFIILLSVVRLNVFMLRVIAFSKCTLNDVSFEVFLIIDFSLARIHNFSFQPGKLNWKMSGNSYIGAMASSRMAYSRMMFSRMMFSRMMFSRTMFRRITFSRMTFSRMTFSRMTFSRMTFSRMTFSRMTFSELHSIELHLT